MTITLKALQVARSALDEQNKWHENYDDIGGYEGSVLQTETREAIKQIDAALDAVQLYAKAMRLINLRLALGFAGIAAFLFLGVSIAGQPVRVMWQYETLRDLIWLLGALYLYVLVDMLLGTYKIWLERKLLLARKP